jgi:3-oxoacyl-[acyl-carrier protein] reductase
MKTPQLLSDQIAWVTGSSRGIGRVIATELCAMGAAVAAHGTRFDSPKTFDEGESMEQVARDIADETNGTTMPVWGDLTDENEVKRVADEIRARFGRIDILVNCAGGDIGPLGANAPRGGRPDPDDCVSISVADIRAVMDRNLMTCILCCREVAPEMMQRKSGRIINIGSTAGSYGRDNGAIYGVAKAAMHHYTRCLAAQLRPHNVTVNCVAPGGTVTPRFLVIHKVDEEKLIEEGTLDRYGRPHEIAVVVGFIASPAAQYVSGQILRVDGGAYPFAG